MKMEHVIEAQVGGVLQRNRGRARATRYSRVRRWPSSKKPRSKVRGHAAEEAIDLDQIRPDLQEL